MNDTHPNKQRNTDLEKRMNLMDRHATDVAIKNHRQKLLNRLFPDKLQKEVVAHRLRLVKNELDFIEKAVKMLRDTQLKAVSEMCSDQIIKWETPRKRELTEFIMEQKIKMEERLLYLSSDFNETISAAYGQAEKLTIPQLRDKAFDRIYKTIDDFNELITHLQSRFQDVITNASSRHGEK